MSTTTAAPPTFPTPRTSATYGVHSEVGVLRKVLVCAPDLAHRRLTPRNCDDLLLDDVLRVDNARRDHLDFVGTAASVPSGSFPRRRRGIVGPAVAWSGACRRGRIW